MDVRILGLVIIAALFGGAIGYGFTALGYDPIIRDLQDQMQAMSGLFEAWTHVVTDLNASVTDLTTSPSPLLVNTSLAQLQTDIATLYTRLATLNTTMYNGTYAIIPVLTELEDLNTTLTQALSDLRSSDLIMTQLNATITDLDRMLRQVDATLLDLMQNVTRPNVQGQLVSSFTDLGSGPDRHEVQGTVINFGTQIAYNTRINITWILDGIDYQYETITLGDLPGHSIRVIETAFWFECSGRTITFTYTISWD